MPYGIPSWKNLVLELLFEQTRAARRLRDLLPHYRRALASWLADYFEYDPVILARVVKTDMRRKSRRATPDRAERHFLEGVRRHLYRGYEQMQARGRARRPRARAALNSLDACADLIARTTGNRGVAAVVTFNFDDLLERALDRRRVRYCVVSDASRALDGGIPIIHPHGYLSQQPAPASIVFTEDDYHRLSDSVFHWAPTSILSHLRSHTALFIGLSMSDPNLRRLLDAAHPSGSRPAHWQIQKRHQIQKQDRARVRANVQERALAQSELLGELQPGDQALKDDEQLSDAINAVLRQADTYDRELFESMGVKTIWLERFDDIPPLLRRISAA